MINIDVFQNPEQINKIFIESDIRSWKEEIEMINIEMIFFKNLVQSHLREYATWGKVNYESLFQGILDVQYYNEISQKSFLKYSTKITNMSECQDIQCENYYLEEHTLLKNTIEKHFSTCKEFKKNIFSYLKTT